MADLYSIGDRVIATRQIWQDATDEHPECLLASAGDVLEVRRVSTTFPNGTYPVSVAHPHREPEAMFGVKLEEIRPDIAR